MNIPSIGRSHSERHVLPAHVLRDSRASRESEARMAAHANLIDGALHRFAGDDEEELPFTD